MRSSDVLLRRLLIIAILTAVHTVITVALLVFVFGRGMARFDAGTSAPVGNYCYIHALDHGRFLLWYAAEDPLSHSRRQKVVRLHIVDANLLEPIMDIEMQCAALDKNKEVYFSTGIVESRWLMAGLDAGVYQHEFSPVLRELDEILVLDAYSGLRVLMLNPQANSFEVFPQDLTHEAKATQRC